MLITRPHSYALAINTLVLLQRPFKKPHFLYMGFLYLLMNE